MYAINYGRLIPLKADITCLTKHIEFLHDFNLKIHTKNNFI